MAAEAIERIEQHMARGNELMASIAEHTARGNELMSRFIEAHEGLRQFTRDIVRRNELVLGRLTDRIDAGTRVLDDLHEESRAQRQAILILIDELRAHGLGGRG